MKVKSSGKLFRIQFFILILKNDLQLCRAPLESVCDESYGGIPAVVAKTIEYIEKEGIKLEGIFRISGNQNEIQNMKKSFDSGSIYFNLIMMKLIININLN